MVYYSSNCAVEVSIGQLDSEMLNTTIIAREMLHFGIRIQREEVCSSWGTQENKMWKLGIAKIKYGHAEDFGIELNRPRNVSDNQMDMKNPTLLFHAGLL